MKPHAPTSSDQEHHLPPGTIEIGGKAYPIFSVGYIGETEDRAAAREASVENIDPVVWNTFKATATPWTSKWTIGGKVYLASPRNIEKIYQRFVRRATRHARKLSG